MGVLGYGQLLGRSWVWGRYRDVPGYEAGVEAPLGMGNVGAFLGMGQILGRSWLWDRRRVVPGCGTGVGSFLAMGQA